MFASRAPFVCLLLCWALSSAPALAQTVTTVVAGPSGFDDALALDAEGNLLASYYYGGRVSKITPLGDVTAFRTGLVNPNGSVVDDEGNFYVAQAGANRVTRIAPDGSVSQVGPALANPVGLVIDDDGSLLVSQYQSSQISRIAPDGTVTIFMSGGLLNGPVGLQKDDAGNLYIGNFNDGRILERAPDGTVSVIGDAPGWLGFIALSGDAVYACGFQANRIYRVPVDGSGMTVLAGTGAAGQADGDVTLATFDGPNGIVASPDGDTLYVTDYGTRSLRRIDGVLTVTSAESVPQRGLATATVAPNPFNPRTTLEYRVVEPARVQLEVFDVRGRRIRTLLDQDRREGTYRIEFDATGLASGVYLARWKVGDTSIVRRMSLVK